MEDNKIEETAETPTPAPVKRPYNKKKLNEERKKYTKLPPEQRAKRGRKPNPDKPVKEPRVKKVKEPSGRPRGRPRIHPIKEKKERTTKIDWKDPEQRRNYFREKMRIFMRNRHGWVRTYNKPSINTNTIKRATTTRTTIQASSRTTRPSRYEQEQLHTRTTTPFRLFKEVIYNFIFF